MTSEVSGALTLFACVESSTCGAEAAGDGNSMVAPLEAASSLSGLFCGILNAEAGLRETVFGALSASGAATAPAGFKTTVLRVLVLPSAAGTPPAGFRTTLLRVLVLLPSAAGTAFAGFNTTLLRVLVLPASAAGSSFAGLRTTLLPVLVLSPLRSIPGTPPCGRSGFNLTVLRVCVLSRTSRLPVSVSRLASGSASVDASFLSGSFKPEAGVIDGASRTVLRVFVLSPPVSGAALLFKS